MITLADLLTATSARLIGPAPAHAFTGFCYDSRRARPGELFVAVKTDRADGHDFIADAVAAGVTGVLCERAPDPLPPGVACLVTPDTRAALQAWAAHALRVRQYGAQIIGVTGSAGKTVTKEAIAAVLAGPYRVFKNPDSYNDLFGLPIALGQLEPTHQVAVLEMASDRFGEIEALCRIARPRVGVVTSVGPAHLAYFGSLNAIAGEKYHLIQALPDDGVAVLNADDDLVRAMRPPSEARVIEYGRDSWADVRTERVQVRPDGLRFLVHAAGARCWFELRLLGRHHVYAALAAAAVGLAYGLSLDDIAARLATLDPLPGRLRPLPGIGGSTLLDDTYSASLPAVLAALELLERCGPGRRIAVLGDLLELGDAEAEALHQVGLRVARAADVLVTKGVQAERIAFEARRAGLSAEQVCITYTAPEAARVVAERLSNGDTVLVKGDRQARLEQVVERLMAEPAQAEALLVRQEPAWKRAPVLYPEERPTWIEVDLEAIAHNCERIKALVGPDVAVMAVLKANAYGHGLAPVARTVLRHGATVLGVAALNEAEALRQADIAAPIMILGYTPAWQARAVARLGLTVAVYSLDVAHALSRAGAALHRPVQAHVKVDSGMGRLGLLPEQVLDFLKATRDLPGLDIEGIFTHFATADEAAEAGDQAHVRRQLDTFQAVLRQARAAGFTFRHVHAANSAATLTLPESHFTMVRPGVALYGLHPSNAVRCPPDLRPALSFKTRVAQVKELPSGHCVSYGCIYWTTRPTTVAVLPVGYADGFRRAPENWGQVLIRGRRAPLIGRVCMDQCMADVTDVAGVRQGDEAVLIGAQGDDRITAEEAAARLGTINYEVVSGLLVRVPRMY